MAGEAKSDPVAKAISGGDALPTPAPETEQERVARIVTTWAYDMAANAAMNVDAWNVVHAAIPNLVDVLTAKK